MSEFSKWQKVYDRAGHEYFYIEQTDEGHYVRDVLLIQCTNTRGDDFTEEEEDGPLRLVKEIFAEPPRAKMNEAIEELGQKIRDLHLTVASLQRTKSGVEKEIRQVKVDLEKEIETYPHHKSLLALLASKQPLFRIGECGWVTDNPEVSVVEFDYRSGVLKDKYNIYDDDRCDFFYDLQVAKTFFIDKFYTNVNYTGWNLAKLENFVQGCEKLGIPDHPEVKRAKEDEKAETLRAARSRIESAQKLIDELSEGEG